MSIVVIYDKGHIAFSKEIVKTNYTLVNAPIESWVCSQGLIIPISTVSYSALRVFDGLDVGIKNQSFYVVGVLLRLDGSICAFSFDTNPKLLEKEVTRYTYELPVGSEVQWCHSEHPSYEEKAYAALLVAESRKDVLPQLIAADLLMAKQLKWYVMEDLVKEVNEIHRVKYPGLYT